ncbi:MAG: cytochrome C oxidase subunit IV family protein [Verrucomicrobiales bacterium]
MAHTAEEVRKSLKKYILIGLILFLGTLLTVWAAGWDLGSHSRNIAFGLLIATVKAGCVALIFMHLSNERGLIYKVLLFTVIFFAGMMFLFVLHLVDPIHHSFFTPLAH